MTEKFSQEDEQKLRAARQEWDQAAADFDEEADHGLHPEPVRQAWTHLLETWLPPAPAGVLDVGCGTGSLSLVVAQLGHPLVGIDLSPAMIARARAKAAAAGQSIRLEVMNAAQPDFPLESFDVILCRHLLWVFDDPAEVLRRWAGLLRPGGRLVIVEGFWSSGAGLHASQVSAALPDGMRLSAIQYLSRQSDFWGKEVSDERYALIADRG